MCTICVYVAACQLQFQQATTLVVLSPIMPLCVTLPLSSPRLLPVSLAVATIPLLLSDSEAIVMDAHNLVGV